MFLTWVELRRFELLTSACHEGHTEPATCANTADPDGRGRGGHPGRGEPGASRDQLPAAAHDLDSRRVRRAGGLAGRGLAAWAVGTVRPAVSAGAVTVLLGLLAWFRAEHALPPTHKDRAGARATLVPRCPARGSHRLPDRTGLHAADRAAANREPAGYFWERNPPCAAVPIA